MAYTSQSRSNVQRELTGNTTNTETWHVQLGGIIAGAHEKDPKVEIEQAYDNA